MPAEPGNTTPDDRSLRGFWTALPYGRHPGDRAGDAAAMMRELGYSPVYALSGGIAEWMQAGGGIDIG